MAMYCDKCDRTFSTQFNYNKHNKYVHGLKALPLSYDKDKFNYKCLELNCNNSFRFNGDLINHLQVQHGFDITSEEKIFNNIDEFETWKANIENNENCLYVMPRGKRKLNSEGTEVKYYICNRSGKPRTKLCDKADSTNNRKRLTKSQGSCKLKYSCTSQIKVTIKEGGTVFVHRWKIHYGHQPELQHLKINDKDQHVIASKLISGVSASKILDATRDNIGTTLKRIDLLTRKDIDNVKRRFHVDIVDGIRHSDDSVSIDLWVEESKQAEHNPVLLYKRQGDTSNEFEDADFCLIIMNNFQKGMLEKFGSNIVCVDGTHGLNNYDFEMNTVMIIDEYGEGYPVSVMFTNRKDTFVQMIFFRCIKHEVGLISPNTFMSDLSNTFYDAWLSVMGPVKQQIYCSWHVDRAWQQNLSKIPDKDKRSAVYKTLKVLQQTMNTDQFHERFEIFIKTLLEDDSTKVFGTYFHSNYVKNFEQWAYCYRKNCGINTNMHLESMHKVIKYFYLERKKVKRLDKGLHAVLKYIRDKTVDRMIKNTKGKSTVHCKDIFVRHRAAVASSFILKQLNNISWIVQSENNDYIVEKLTEMKCCNMVCTFCQICAHMYTCTCPDFFIKNVLCKHIHFVVINANSTCSSNKVDTSTHFESPITNKNTEQNGFTNHRDMTLKNSLQEQLKTDFLDLHAKISIADFNKLNPEIVKDINMHVNVIKNLLKISLVDQTKPSSFQNVSSEHPNKIVDKQFRFHSTQKKRVKRNILYKKPDKIESLAIKDFLSGSDLYISHDNTHDHLYTETE